MDGSIHIPLAEERLDVTVEEKTTGTVRVRTSTELVEELVTADLERTAVDVRHVPIDRIVEIAPEIRVEGDVTIIPILEEVLVVEKRLILKEEIHITRLTTLESAEIPVTLRKQSATVERVEHINANKGENHADRI